MYRILSLLWLGWALVGHAAAQDFPSRPVMFTVPFAAGGPADVIARILANGMSKVLNQQFVVENTVGAGGTIGTAKVASSPSDGYSLLLMHISHAANVAFCPNLRYDPVKDFEPIGLVAESPMAIVARKNFPASNFKEFITYLSANNDKMTYGWSRRLPQRLRSASRWHPIFRLSQSRGCSIFRWWDWYAMYAPKGTPKPVIDKLSAALQKALQDPEV